MLPRPILAAMASIVLLQSASILVLAVSAVPARADKAPVIVIPSRPGVPTVINGRNANYAVVEGDWGLARPGHMPQTVIGGSPLYKSRYYAPRVRYFPAYGAPPMRGRYEVDPGPGRVLPEPAQPYSRSWTSPPQPGARPISANGYYGSPGSSAEERNYYQNTPNESLPPTIRDPHAVDPPMVVVPQIRGRWR